MTDVGPEALDLLKVSEVAERLRLSVKTVRRLVADKKIEAVRIGTSVRIAPEAVVEYKNRLRADAQQSGPKAGEAA